MEIRNIVVNLDIDPTAPDALPAAIDLASRFGASLTGFVGAEPSPMLIGLDGGVSTGAWYVEERERIEASLRDTEQRFRSQVPAAMKSSWRGYGDSPNRALAGVIRCADLIVVAASPNASLNPERHLRIGELVLSAGRPVLVVANTIPAVKADKVVVAWKDTREARRAAMDALPLLKAASDVLAVTVDEEGPATECAALYDFVAWLASHGVTARGKLLPVEGTAAAQIEAEAVAMQADLIVSGGYGHTRLREWLFGGVTRDLLGNIGISRLFSS